MGKVPLSNRARRVLAWTTALGATGWAAALFAAPYCAGHCATGSPGIAGSAAAYVLASLLCHQEADRSFEAWGVQLPVCARCTGLYVGAAIGALAAVIGTVRSRRLPKRAVRSLRAWRIGLAVAAVPTAATVVLEKLFGVGVSNASRGWAGGVLGAAVGWVVVASIRRLGPCGEETPEVNCPNARNDDRPARDR